MKNNKQTAQWHCHRVNRNISQNEFLLYMKIVTMT